ncbi:MAG: DUF4142 domain-containing protein [Gammaproteobacteria bacterium]
MTKLITFAALVLASIVSVPSVIAGGKLNDLQIAHAAYTAGNLDIRYAHLALAMSDNASVRDFAQTMIRDHGAVNDEAVALVKKLNVTPEDNDLSRALVSGAAKKRAQLRHLHGNAFDCAYARNELGYHQVVNKTVEGNFIPNATVPELKALLDTALVTFKAHEKHAEHMVEELECAS